MKPNDIIKHIMKEQGYTYQSLADKLGKSHASAISNTLLRVNGMRIDTFLELIETMGYKIVVIPEAHETHEEWIEVTSKTTSR